MSVGFVAAILLSGLFTGALARLAIPGPDPMPVWLTIAIGLTGSIVGVLLHGAVGTILSIIIAAIVAALLLVIWGRIQGGRTRTV